MSVPLLYVVILRNLYASYRKTVWRGIEVQNTKPNVMYLHIIYRKRR